MDKTFTVVIPVYNDWEALSLLLDHLAEALVAKGLRANAVVVDDGSTVAPPAAVFERGPDAIASVCIVRLRRNLGHQRAIAIGLTYVFDRSAATEIVVMDGDGEDDPRDVPRLIATLRSAASSSVVFAERSKRSESLAFHAFYRLFLLLHLLLIGRAPRVGNFSALSRDVLERLVVTPEMWNHYAATVHRSRVMIVRVPSARARRLSGRPVMGFVGLVMHGLSAVAVYADIVGVRLLAFTVLLIPLSLAVGFASVVLKLFTPYAVPTWATLVVGLSALACLQATILVFVLCLTVLSSRNQMGFIPIRDYGLFIGEVHGGETSS
jgi:polyisoprenyl-phosphate glycosyltransferase